MRGSIFYDSSRLHAKETNKFFEMHKERLEQINSRQKSSMRKYFSRLTPSR